MKSWNGSSIRKLNATTRILNLPKPVIAHLPIVIKGTAIRSPIKLRTVGFSFIKLISFARLFILTPVAITIEVNRRKITMLAGLKSMVISVLVKKYTTTIRVVRYARCTNASLANPLFFGTVTT